MVNYSVGIWRHAQLPAGVIYRWQRDGGATGGGYVLFDPANRTIRPCDADGTVTADLTLDTGTGDLAGAENGLDQAAFCTVAAAIVKRYRATGQTPETAHTYFG